MKRPYLTLEGGEIRHRGDYKSTSIGNRNISGFFVKGLPARIKKLRLHQ